MPFKSEAQRRYLWANEPEIARDWADTYGSRIEAALGGIMRLGLKRGSGGPAGGATIGSGSKQSGSPASSGGHGGPGPHAGGGGSGPAHLSHNAPPPRNMQRNRIQNERQAELDLIGAPPGRNTAPTPIPQQQNFMQKGMDLYNQYGILPNAIRFGTSLFTPKTAQQKLQANINKGYDVNNPAEMHGLGTRRQPTLATSGGGDGQQQQYYPPWWYEDYAENILEDEEELDIDTSTGDMEEWVQRFRVKDPYRQDRGALDEQIKERISKLYT